jgi:hypothetical protein
MYVHMKIPFLVVPPQPTLLQLLGGAAFCYIFSWIWDWTCYRYAVLRMARYFRCGESALVAFG